MLGAKVYRQYRLFSLPTLLFLALFMAASCVSPLFFALFSPDSIVRGLAQGFYVLDGFVKVQFAFLMFILAYSVPFFFRGSIKNGTSGQPVQLSISLSFVVYLYIGSIGFSIFAKLLGTSDAIQYLGNGLYNYFCFLPVIMGYSFNKFDKMSRILAISSIGLVCLFFSMANARALAMFGPISFFVGFLYSNYATAKMKVYLLYLCILITPLYLAVANTTRFYGGLAPGFEDMSERASILREAGQYVGDINISEEAFLRLYPFVANLIISTTPGQVDYLGIHPLLYGKELLLSILPQFTGDEARFNYTGRWIPKRYGVEITETTAVGITMVGHFWMFFGLTTVLVGGFILGLVHRYVSVLLVRVSKRDFFLALLIIAMLGEPYLWGQGRDFIEHMRQIVTHIAGAYIVYGFYLILRQMTEKPQSKRPN
jgi:hypothetical protein